MIRRWKLKRPPYNLRLNPLSQDVMLEQGQPGILYVDAGDLPPIGFYGRLMLVGWEWKLVANGPRPFRMHAMALRKGEAITLTSGMTWVPVVLL